MPGGLQDLPGSLDRCSGMARAGKTRHIKSDNFVAYQFLNPAVRMDKRCCRHLVETIDESAELGRIELLGQSRRATNIGKQQRRFGFGPALEMFCRPLAQIAKLRVQLGRHNAQQAHEPSACSFEWIGTNSAAW